MQNLIQGIQIQTTLIHNENSHKITKVFILNSVKSTPNFLKFTFQFLKQRSLNLILSIKPIKIFIEGVSVCEIKRFRPKLVELQKLK